MADDSYLAIASIANDHFMTERMNACVTQQHTLGSIDLGEFGVNPYNLLEWVKTNRYVWAASPGWGDKWTYAYASHPDDDNYEPGKDAAVITDGDILATVQHLGTPAES